MPNPTPTPPEPLTPVVGQHYHVTPNTNAQGQTLVVPNPERGHQALPADGSNVVWSVYWQKRFNDNEITVALPST